MRIALYPHAGSLNRGNEAILRGTIPLLREAFPGCTIDIYSHYPQEDTAFEAADTSVKSFLPHRMPNIHKYSMDWLKLAKYRFESQEKADTFFFTKVFSYSDIAECDLALSVGGDNYCYGTVSDFAAVQLTLSAANKPAVLWGCSLDSDTMTPQKQANLLRYKAITARETRTYAMLTALGCGEKTTLAPDPAFGMEPDECPLPSGFVPGETVLLNLSPYITEKNDCAVEACIAFVRSVLADGGTVGLLPHVTREGVDDRQSFRPLEYAFTDRTKVFNCDEDGRLTAPQLKYIISKARLLVAARTHAAIAAYSSAVPALALGYSAKSAAIAEDLFCGTNPWGVPALFPDTAALTISASELTGNSLIVKAKALLEKENELRAHMAEAAPLWKANAAAAAAALKQFACTET
ncbi:MAG: polysaccharide pyruvyl transferase family protein [Oscillospiraceae bacterium]|jgi:polysaccharide pyruvyl transferase WcaK-like protein|nr:polysaccharide pyruvyl transferase family protein [Oscillospiraceae bacterium]